MSKTVEAALRSAGHDVEWVGGWSADPGDPDILAIAYSQGRVLVTIDRGFGALAVLEHRPHAGIIVIRKTPAEEHAAVCLRAIRDRAEDLRNGAVVIATSERIRARWPDPSA